MEHCDADALTLSALGEPTLDAADVEHLLGCRRCTDDLRAFRRTVVTARGPRAEVPVEPPPQVWDAVVAELGLHAGAPPAAVDALRPQEGPAPSEPRRGRAARRLAVAAGAVVLALAAGAAGAALAERDDDGDRGDVLAPELAIAELEPLPGSPDGPGTSGTARLVGEPAERLLQVQVSGLPDSAGYYEVWLIDPATSAMVSLGLLPTSDEPAALRVPGGVDIDAYSLVDVSDEPLDGDPTHSRVSVARGVLAAG